MTEIAVNISTQLSANILRRFIAVILLGLSAQLSCASYARAQSDEATRFVRFAQIDPVFAWPGVNLPDMELVISQLRSSRSEIASLSAQQYGSDQAKRVKTNLYPINFLSEMVRLERARRGLSFHSTADQLLAYQTQLRRTVRSYQTYIDHLLPALVKTFKEQKSQGLEFHFGHSTFRHFAKGLLKYRLQADQRLKAANHRWNCLRAPSPDCQEPVWPILKNSEIRQVNEAILTAAPATIIEKLHHSSKAGGRPVSPHWAVLSEHQCGVNKPQSYYSLWEFGTDLPVPIWRAETIDDILVHDHRVSKADVSKYELELNRLGAEGYLHQTTTNHYACPDAGSDTAEIRAMVHVYRTLAEIDWTAISAKSPGLTRVLSALSAGSRLIVEKPFVTQDRTQGFMRRLSLLFNRHSDRELQNLLGSSLHQKLRGLLLTYRFKTHNLTRDIMNVVYNNTAIGDYVRLSNWDYISELFFTRNAPELLLGGSNPSIVGRNFSQVQSHRRGISPRLRSYNADLSKQFNADAFTRILIKGANAEYILNQQTKRDYLKD